MFKNVFLCVGVLLCVTSLDAHANEIKLPDPLEAGWQGKAVCERLFEDSHKRILRCSFPPNVGHERHFHRPHFGYAISGGRVQIKDKTGIREVQLRTGSSYTSKGVEWHEILNIGKTTIVYLIVEDLS